MITPDDNGYGRVKRWREKNRAYVNLKQREYRRKKRGDGEGSSELATERPHDMGQVSADKSPSPLSTIDELRELVRVEEEKPTVEAPAAPVGGIYRNDAGGVISKFAWEKLQEAKRKAKDGGYEIDDYSQ